MNAIDNYYMSQAMGLPHFTGPTNQKGYGLGGIFRSLFRAVVPLFRRAAPVAKAAAKSAAKEALRTGANVAEDVLHGASLQESLKSRGGEGAQRLVARGVRKLNKMVNTPKGIKRKPPPFHDIFE